MSEGELWGKITERLVWGFFLLSTVAIVILLETIFLNRGCTIR